MKQVLKLVISGDVGAGKTTFVRAISEIEPITTDEAVTDAATLMLKEYTTVAIEGLQDNFDKAVSLYEDVIKNVKADETALTALKARIAKSRKDSKANKGAILQGLTSYAIYGAKNKFNNNLSNQELEEVTSQELMERLKNLNNYEQTVIYYGPTPLPALVGKLQTLHTVPTTFTATSALKEFKQTNQTQNQVLFTDYDMVQAETRWIRNTENYDTDKNTIVNVFNNYFGGGMGSLVFQTIRESKALAYSTFGYYIAPQKKDQEYYMLGYVGSQAGFVRGIDTFNVKGWVSFSIAQRLSLFEHHVKVQAFVTHLAQNEIGCAVDDAGDPLNTVGA